MIQQIIMDDVASYKEPIEINDLKKFNLFYGLNGVGKTVLSQYLASNSGDIKFNKCQLINENGSDNPEVIVYNEDFIRENFWSSDSLKGIFTLDKVNVEAEQAIVAARNELTKLMEANKKSLEEISTLKEKNNQDRNIIKEHVWAAKISYENTSLEDCLKGSMGSKDAFLDKLLSAKPLNLEANQDIDQLLKVMQIEMAELQSANNGKKILYKLLDSNFEVYETSPILLEKIVGSQDSYLSKLIAKLNHSDWVNQGITKYLDNTDNCPFCNQGIDPQLKEKLKSYIDTTYQTKLNELTQLKIIYQQNIASVNLVLDVLKTNTTLLTNKGLQSLASELQEALKANLLLIENKMKEPSQPIVLKNTQKTTADIDSILTAENVKLEAFNVKISHKEKAIEDIKVKFWKILCKKYEREIQNYQQQCEFYKKEHAVINNKREAIARQISIQNKIISENQNKTKNIDIAINRINRYLRLFGLEGFYIGKSDVGDGSHLYKIERQQSSQEQDTFKSLSEGEKTLISFLYFVEKCIGVENPDHVAIAQNRIIVIDDPISSLSFNLVFDIAVLIKDNFLNSDTDYRQIFILTHHLYFFHELVHRNNKNLKKNLSCYRVMKCEKTNILPMEVKEIQNSYEALWQIIKDISKGNVSSIILPNTIRNILEFYFSFMKKNEEMSTILKEMADNDNDPSLRAFERYIQRGSHSDQINLTDMSEIDLDKFISYFKSVFEKMGFLEHYQEMMDEELFVVQSNTAKPTKGIGK